MSLDLTGWWRIMRSSSFSGISYEYEGDDFMEMLAKKGFDVAVLSFVRIASYAPILYTTQMLIIRIPDLETLTRLSEVAGYPVILSPEGRPRSVEVYDDWRE